MHKPKMKLAMKTKFTIAGITKAQIRRDANVLVDALADVGDPNIALAGGRLTGYAMAAVTLAEEVEEVVLHMVAVEGKARFIAGVVLGATFSAFLALLFFP